MKAFEKRALAKQLFMSSEKTQIEIADTVGVTAKTISKWKSEESWEEQKTATTITKSELLKSAYLQLKKLNDHIENELNGIPDKSTSDSKAILIKEIERLDNDPLHVHISVCQELLGYIGKHLPGKLLEMAELTNKFIQFKAR